MQMKTSNPSSKLFVLMWYCSALKIEPIPIAAKHKYVTQPKVEKDEDV